MTCPPTTDRRWLACLGVLAMLGCTGGDTDTGEPGERPDESGALPLEDRHNYTYEGSLSVPSRAAPAQTDFGLDWSGLTIDLQCHGLDPVTDINNIMLITFPYLSQDEIEVHMSEDSLLQSDIGGFVNFETEGATTASLSDFKFLGNEAQIVERFEADAGTWMLMFATGTELGVGGRWLEFLAPTDGASETQGFAGNCDVLDFEADLVGADVLPVLPEGPWLVDWTALSRNGRGAELDDDGIDGLMVARYDDLSVNDLQDQFLDIELLADAVWTAPIEGGRTADLSAATTADGAPLTAIDPDSTWLFALRCSRCANPAPLFLTVLAPRDP